MCVCVCVCVCVCERERERQTDRERETEKKVEREGARMLYANTQHGCEGQISNAEWRYGTG